MRTRRELLLMGGAGAAAVALPSLGLPRLANIVQAQGRGQGQARSLVDPLFREIEAQFGVLPVQLERRRFESGRDSEDLMMAVFEIEPSRAVSRRFVDPRA